MTIEKLRKLESIVKPILEEQPLTRKDDYFLYAEVLRVYNPALLELSAKTFLLGHTVYNVPNIKSIERVRRKIQAKYPHLANEQAKRKRLEEQATYIDYSNDLT